MSKDSKEFSDTSANLALATNDVHFPPAHLSDFVIHYRGTSYYVHKFVLDYHSSYFRTYIESLINGQRVYSKEECDQHPEITHCIRVPDSVGKVQADADDFRVFLCHFYFPQYYSCIPYAVATHIDLTAQPPPVVSLEYPHFDNFQQLNKKTRVGVSVGSPDVYEAVMSLCHYFDCERVLCRAEDNCLLHWRSRTAADYKTCSEYDLEWNELWPSFRVALLFGLQRMRKECMPRVAKLYKNCHHRNDIDECLRKYLDKDTAYEMMQAAVDKL